MTMASRVVSTVVRHSLATLSSCSREGLEVVDRGVAAGRRGRAARDLLRPPAELFAAGLFVLFGIRRAMTELAREAR
jgi:hypothetical protein